MRGNFVTIVPQLLHVSIVGVLVRQEECRRNGASVRVGSVGGEDFLVDLPVFVVDSIVESENDHLWRFLWLEIAWDQCSIDRAEAIGQSAVVGIASRRRVGIVLRVAIRFVRPIVTILLALFAQWNHESQSFLVRLTEYLHRRTSLD